MLYQGRNLSKTEKKGLYKSVEKIGRIVSVLDEELHKNMNVDELFEISHTLRYVVNKFVNECDDKTGGSA